VLNFCKSDWKPFETVGFQIMSKIIGWNRGDRARLASPAQTSARAAPANWRVLAISCFPPY